MSSTTPFGRPPVSGDFDGDGVQDSASFEPAPIGRSAFVISYAHESLYVPMTAESVNDLVAGDFNGDGWLDLAVGDNDLDALVLLNDPAHPGTFLPEQPLSAPGSFGKLLSLAAGDFNGDGLTDLVGTQRDYAGFEYALRVAFSWRPIFATVTAAQPGRADFGDQRAIDTDHDGVRDDVEDGVPYAGDGMPDRDQANVASLPNGVDGRYVTLESPPGTRLVHVRTVNNPDPTTSPSPESFPVGFLAFDVEGVIPGGSTTVTLFLPPDVRPNTYYKFGRTSDRFEEHWYPFLFDGATGAEFHDNALTLHFVDGDYGDGDLTANGRIKDPDGPSLLPPPIVIDLGGSSGAETDNQTQQFTWNANAPGGNLASVLVTVTRNGSSVFSSTSAGSSFNFDDLGLGTFEIMVLATDALGGTTTAGRSATVTDDDTTPPAITLGGSSGAENTTQTQQFTWNASDAVGLSGVSVTVKQGSTTIFTSTADSGTFNFDSLGAGTYAIDVSATDNDNDWLGDALIANASRSVVVSVLVPPSVQSVAINDGSAQRSMVNGITVTFAGRVNLPANPVDAFSLVRKGGGSVELNVALSEVNGKTVAVLTFRGAGIFGGSLADGNYTLTVRADKVHDAAGVGLDRDRIDAFFRLFGDTDGDRDVDVADTLRFFGVYGRRLGNPGYLWYLDWNQDSVINLTDAVAFLFQLTKRLAP